MKKVFILSEYEYSMARYIEQLESKNKALRSQIIEMKRDVEGTENLLKLARLKIAMLEA